MNSIQSAMRRLVADRWHVGAIILTLVIGIGLIVVAYAIFDGLLLRPWPVPRPGEVFVASRGVSAAEFRFIRTEIDGATLAAVAQSCPPVRDSSDRLVSCEIVSGNFFKVLGLSTERGRSFLDTDDAPGHPTRVVVIGFGVWRDNFGFSDDVVGRSVALNGKEFTIIGVAPQRTIRRNSSPPPQYWFPLAAYGDLTDYAGRDFLFDKGVCCVDMVVRVGPDRAALTEKITQLHRRFRDGDSQLSVIGLRDTRPISENWSDSGPVLVAMLSLSGLVILVVCCVNVSIVQLGRGWARRRDFAVMHMLGANRWMLAQSMFWESLLLVGAVACGVLVVSTIALTLAETRLLAAYGESGFDLQPNLRVLSLCLLLTAAAVLTVGVLPVIRGARGPEALIQRRRRVSWIVAAQIACSTGTILSAGLLWQGLERASSEMGFVPQNVDRVVFLTNSDSARLFSTFAELESEVGAEGVRRSPQVAAAGPSRLAPSVVVVDGPVIDIVEVVPMSESYLPLLGVPLVEGRLLQASDSTAAVVVNEAFSRRVGAAGAVGKVVELDGRKQVVGVVQDLRPASAGKRTRPTAFVLEQDLSILFTRSDEPTRSMVQKVAASAAVSAPIRFEPWSEALGRGLRPATAVRSFMLALAVVALIVASCGLFAVVSLAARLRKREIAIRIALGAGVREVSGLLFGLLARSILVGAVTGFAIGQGLAPVLQRLVITINPLDPVATLVTGVVTSAIAVFVVAPAAVGAYRVPPIDELRASD